MRVWSHYFEHRRPPLKDAYFIHQLPATQREKVLEACRPSVLLSDLLVAEAELGYRGLDPITASRLNETLHEVASLSPDYIDGIAVVWPVEKAVERVHHAILVGLQDRSPNHTSVSFVVCHCREPLDWLTADVGEVPFHSTLFVYEKCGEDSSGGLSEMGAYGKFSGGVRVIQQKDGVTRGDECTAYLQYIRDSYDGGLPDYTVFLQSDPDHHLFLSYLNTALSALRVSRYEVPFLHLNFHRHYQTTTPCMRDVERLLFNFTDPVLPEPLIGTYCCAQFIVSRARILHQPKLFYDNALAMVNGSMNDVCSPVPPKRSSHCYVLEYLWHVVFGEERFLPFKADDERLPLALRMKFGNENVKTRWTDVELAKNIHSLINRTVEH